MDEVQLQRAQTHHPMHQTKRSKPLLMGLAIGIPLVVTLGVVGWLLPRNTATNAANNQPVETVNSISDPTQVSDNTVGGNPFKCEGLNLTGQDLRNENFRNADCTRGQLAGVNLSGMDIENANLSGADLRNADLSNANLKNANLTEADLTGADLSGANLENVNLSKAELNNANLNNTTIKQTNFAESKLEGAKIDLRAAKREQSNFSNATLPDGTTHP
ncbi:MAG TPA: hypothetical protein DDZ80_29495 [Cyanobacteria bacterium UBA8803]|nr:hypothetical protein [Cyanobacteria bacterium UBA8803]